jgi:hypothetical protein
MGEYHGIIVKESLKDESVLNKMKILGQKKRHKMDSAPSRR